MSGLLAGVRVLDLTWVLSGPYATMLFADMGADVIKIERPGSGDPARTNAPMVGGLSTYFASLNRGKRSLALDLQSARGKELFLQLVQRADVVVENFKAGTLERMGLGYETLASHNPRIILAAISGFGQTGEYRDRPAYDVIVQAMAGTLSINGTPDSGPLRVGFSVGDIAAGLYAAIGILGALYEREQSGCGQQLDVAMLDCQMALLENAFAAHLATGRVPRAIGGRHPVKTPFQTFPTADGHVAVACSSEEDWRRLCAAMGHDEWAADARYLSNDLRTANHAALQADLLPVFQSRRTDEWVALLIGVGIPVGPVRTIDQVAQDANTAARAMVKEVEHRQFGRIRLVNHPVKYSRSAAGISGPPPALSEHTEGVLTEWLGLSLSDVEGLRTEGVIA